MRIKITLLFLLLTSSCSPNYDKIDISDAASPPENLQVSGGKTTLIVVDGLSDIVSKCGKETYGCVVGSNNSTKTTLYIANPCKYRDKYARALCHEWGHVMQFELGIKPNHDGWEK